MKYLFQKLECNVIFFPHPAAELPRGHLKTYTFSIKYAVKGGQYIC